MVADWHDCDVYAHVYTYVNVYVYNHLHVCVHECVCLYAHEYPYVRS